MTVPPRTRMTPERRQRASLRARARGRWRRVGRAIGVLLGLLLVLAGLVLSPEALAVAQGRGVLGTFTAEVEECSPARVGEFCTWYGTFVSDDGTIEVADVAFSSERPIRRGETFRLLFPEHGASSVYDAGDRFPLVVCFSFIVGGLGYLGWWAIAVIHWWRRRLRTPSTAVGNNRCPTRVEPHRLKSV